MKLSDQKTAYEPFEMGGWVDKIEVPTMEGIRLKVRALYNSDALRLRQTLVGALAEDKAEDPDELEKIEDEILKRTVLLGWEGIEDPFTKENVDLIFADPVLRPLYRNAIRVAALQMQQRAGAKVETDSKN